MGLIKIVTGNAMKFAEMSEALSHFDIDSERIDIDIVEAKGLDGEFVTRDKAQKAFAEAGEPVIVDDSGIYFESYNNFPGTYAKFAYQTLGFTGLFKLVSPGDRATFISYVAYMDDSLDDPIIFRGEYAGVIVDDFDQTKEYEMPYAPMFLPEGSDKRMSEMTPEERGHDHRHQAVNAFAEWFLANR